LSFELLDFNIVFSKKSFITGMLLGIVLLFTYLFTLPDGKLHIVFCDVGQGDAAYIRTPSSHDILIDGGPNDKVLTCLGNHMPFYDRTIDIIVLTHPQKDHLQGLISVIQRYNVKYFVIGPEGNETEGYKLLLENIKKENIPVKNLYQGDEFSLGNVKFSVLWPERNYVASQLSPQLIDSSYLSQGNILGLATATDPNNFSYYLHLQYGTFDTLFTGDGDIKIQPEIIRTANLPDVEVLKFPHHGSKTGISSEFLELIKPEFSVISVGKNSYGHPTNEAIKQLNDRAIEIKRTDLEGDIEVVSNGNTWSN